MKFSLTFKYSSVTFKNKETKETIVYDTKGEGNTFTFDNIDEDVVIGVVKGIKDRKASQVFAYDDLRTNFINVMARNKCKELYDKIDKNEWKVEDVAVSNITIKDLEFTKPTMNAREVITVESRKTKRNVSNDRNTIYINWHWSSEYDSGDSGSEEIPIEDISEENIKRKVEEFCNKEWPEAGGHCDGVYVEVFVDLVPESDPVFLFDGGFSYGKIDWYKPDDEKHRYIPGGKIYVEGISKKNYSKGAYPTWVVKERLVDLIEGCPRENPMWADLVEILEKYYGSMEAEKLVGESIYDSNLDEALNLLNEAAASLHMAMFDIKDELGKDHELFKRVERNYNDVHETYGIMEEFMDKGEIEIMNESESLLDKEYHEAYLNGVEIQDKMKKIGEFIRDEGFTNHMSLMKRIGGVMKEMKEIMDDLEYAVDDIQQDEYGNSDDFQDNIDQSAQAALDKETYAENRTIVKEDSGNVEPVIFKKDRRDGEIVAFFPETMFDGSVNKGNIMCYAHDGQSSEASIEYFQNCRPCRDESEYVDLLAELERQFRQGGEQTTLKVVKKPSYKRGSTRRPMWPSRF